MNVKSTTKIHGIFGHPVKQSLSPVMHNSAFGALGIDGVYVAFDVLPENLESAVQGIRAMGIRGVNVTIPHKQKIIPFLDEISPDAELMGAVNTVDNKNGNLTGYNTDVGGFLRAIKEDLDFHPEGKIALVLGAGGACRAVLSALCTNRISGVFLVNRTYSTAKALTSEFGEIFQQISVKPISLACLQEIKDALPKTDILINSTSVGMEGKGSFDIPLELLKSGSVVYDLVYKPRETELVKQAKSLGHNASGGLGMLVYQGAESFEIWTGKSAPVDAMREAVS